MTPERGTVMVATIATATLRAIAATLLVAAFLS